MAGTTGIQTATINPNSMTAGGPGGDPNWINSLGSLAQLGGSIYGLVNSAGLSGDASTVLAQSNPFGQYRPQYGAQLMQLMQNPSSVTQLPGYQFMMDQGTQAVNRSAYGPGGTGPGGQLSADLMKYGQGLASQFYEKDIADLSYLAGAGISPANPAQALQTKGGAATSLGSSIAGLTSGLSGTAALLSKLFGGTSAPTANAGSGLNSQQASDLSALFNGTYGAPNSSWDTGFSNVSSNMGYDPTTGSFSGNQTPDFSQFSMGSGYSPTTGDFYSGGLGSMSLGDLSGGGGGGSVDLSGLFANPKAAGGEAANLTNNPNAVSGGAGQQPSGLDFGSILGTGSQLFGIGSGLAKGTPMGYAGAGVGLTRLAARNASDLGLSASTASSLKSYGAAAGDILGIIQGIQTGGAVGDTQAAASSAMLGSQVGLLPSAVGSAAGYVAAPLAVYDFVKSYQSGNTGSDTMQGASAGAAVGSAIVPGIGTAVGVVAGAAIGAIASAFGPGRTDAETSIAQNLINWTSSNNNSQAAAMAVKDPYLMLGGLMDEHHSDLPIYQKYGRANEIQFSRDMMSQINDALKSGTISKNDNPQAVFAKVVQPWVDSMGDWSKVGDTYQNVVNGLLQNMTAQYMAGEEYTNWQAVGGDNPFLGATPFGGTYVPQPVTAASSPGSTGGRLMRF